MELQIAYSFSDFCKEKGLLVSEFNAFFSDEYSKYLQGERILIYSSAWIIPVTIKKRSIFCYATFLSEPKEYNSAMGEFGSHFLTEVCNYMHSAYRIQWTNPAAPSTLFSFVPDYSISIPFGSHIIDLTLPEETLLANMHSKHRNVVRKAIKDGVEVKIGGAELLRDYCVIDEQTWSRSNRKGEGESEYERFVKALPNNTRVYVSYFEGHPQTGAIIMYNKQMAYYLYGASINHTHNGSGNLLQWDVIKDMQKEGVLKYSFVGCRINVDENSKYYGIQMFKSRFGGELFEGKIFKVIYNPFMYHLFRFAATIKSTIHNKHYTPYLDIIDQEIHKWPQ